MLKYAEVEHLVQTGDVFVFKGKSIFAKMVRRYTLSEYTHAGIAYRMPTNGHTRLCVFEALEPGGVRLFPIDKYLKNGAHVDWFRLTDEWVFTPQIPTGGDGSGQLQARPKGKIEREKIADFAQRQWGESYAIRQVWWSFGLLAPMVRFLFRKQLNEVEKSKFFCSQLVAGAFVHAGWEPEEGLEPWQTTPENVSRFPCLQRMGRLGL